MVQFAAPPIIPMYRAVAQSNTLTIYHSSLTFPTNVVPLRASFDWPSQMATNERLLMDAERICSKIQIGQKVSPFIRMVDSVGAYFVTKETQDRLATKAALIDLLPLLIVELKDSIRMQRNELKVIEREVRSGRLATNEAMVKLLGAQEQITPLVTLAVSPGAIKALAESGPLKIVPIVVALYPFAPTATIKGSVHLIRYMERNPKVLPEGECYSRAAVLDAVRAKNNLCAEKIEESLGAGPVGK